MRAMLLQRMTTRQQEASLASEFYPTCGLLDAALDLRYYVLTANYLSHTMEAQRLYFSVTNALGMGRGGGVGGCRGRLYGPTIQIGGASILQGLSGFTQVVYLINPTRKKWKKTAVAPGTGEAGDARITNHSKPTRRGEAWNFVTVKSRVNRQRELARLIKENAHTRLLLQPFMPTSPACESRVLQALPSPNVQGLAHVGLRVGGKPSRLIRNTCGNSTTRSGGGDEGTPKGSKHCANMRRTANRSRDLTLETMSPLVPSST